VTEIIYLRNKDDTRTMNNLRLSIEFYKENNTDGRYDRALQKETKMLEWYRSNIQREAA